MKIWSRSRTSIIAAAACPENYVADSFMVCQNSLSNFFYPDTKHFELVSVYAVYTEVKYMITLSHNKYISTLILKTRSCYILLYGRYCEDCLHLM
jgi:hypothetical protein